MTAYINKPWFIDGRTGTSVTYGDLLADLNRSPVSLRPLCQSASTQDALREIAACLAFGTELTLFDTDFGESELAALGFGKEQLNQPKPTPAAGPVDLAALQKAAAGGSRARLGLFTSGSTGLPKLVWQGIGNLARAVKVSPRRAEAVWALGYNPTHIAGIQVYLQALANGCPLVDVHGLDRAATLVALERYGVTHLSGTPSFYRLLLPADRPLPEVRSVTLGGESSDAALLERLRPMFPAARFHNVYASTEAGTLLMADGDVFSIAAGLADRVVVRDDRIHVHRSLLGEFASPGANPPTLKLRRDSSGGVATGEDDKQRTEDGGRRTAEGGGRDTETGNLKRENREQKTTGVDGKAEEPQFQLSGFSSQFSTDWYDTGDVVEVVRTEPLRFRIVARERDWVNVGGSKVNPHEVEAVLGEHPGVAQVRVFGRKNSVMGHILCAEIVLMKPDGGRQTADGGQPTEPALREFAAARLQPFKIPRLIRFVDKIEQTRTGKVSRQ